MVASKFTNFDKFFLMHADWQLSQYSLTIVSKEVKDN